MGVHSVDAQRSKLQNAKMASERHPQISVQIVQHVASCVERAGHPSAPLITQFALGHVLKNDVDLMVLLADYVAFFEAAAAVTGDTHFGLYAARMTDTDSLGPLSILFSSAPTLGEAFHGFTRFLNAMQEGTTNQIIVERDQARYEYGIEGNAIRARRQDSEYSIGAMLKLIRNFVGVQFVPIEVQFEHERVGDYQTYASYFDCPVFFEQPINRLIFSADVMERSSTGFSRRLFPIISSHLQSMSMQHEREVSLSKRVGHCLDTSTTEKVPDLATVARALGRAPATLHRHLRSEGTSFRHIITARKMTLACRLLTTGKRSILDIALMAGYAESASFIRAFKTIHGITPMAYRRAAAVPYTVDVSP